LKTSSPLGKNSPKEQTFPLKVIPNEALKNLNQINVIQANQDIFH
jgi:hypothetical protein